MTKSSIGTSLVMMIALILIMNGLIGAAKHYGSVNPPGTIEQFVLIYLVGGIAVTFVSLADMKSYSSATMMGLSMFLSFQGIAAALLAYVLFINPPT